MWIRLSIFLITFLTFLPLKAQEELMLSFITASQEAYNKGNLPEAETALQGAVKAASDDATRAMILSNLGMIRSEMGKDSLALQSLNEALSITPNAVTILNNRARVNASLGRIEDAISDCTSAITRDTMIIEPLYLRGLLKLKKGDIEGCKTDFHRMELLEPGAEQTHLALATLFTETGDFDKAVPHYSKLIIRDPQADYYASRALCYLMTDRYTQAGEDIEAGKQLDPENGEFYLLRALLYKRQYLIDDARTEAKRALEHGVSPERLKSLL